VKVIIAVPAATPTTVQNVLPEEEIEATAVLLLLQVPPVDDESRRVAEEPVQTPDGPVIGNICAEAVKESKAERAERIKIFFIKQFKLWFKITNKTAKKHFVPGASNMTSKNV
jgi:hypothetical protein